MRVTLESEGGSHVVQAEALVPVKAERGGWGALTPNAPFSRPWSVSISITTMPWSTLEKDLSLQKVAETL